MCERNGTWKEWALSWTNNILHFDNSVLVGFVGQITNKGIACLPGCVPKECHMRHIRVIRLSCPARKDCPYSLRPGHRRVPRISKGRSVLCQNCARIVPDTEAISLISFPRSFFPVSPARQTEYLPQETQRVRAVILLFADDNLSLLRSVLGHPSRY